MPVFKNKKEKEIRLFEKYYIRLLQYPILVVTSLYGIDKKDWERITKYCEFIHKINGKFEKAFIFRFRSLEHYRKFVQRYIHEDYAIVVKRMKIIRMKRVVDIEFDGSKIKLILEGGKTDYKTSLGVVKALLEYLEEHGEVEIKEFERYLKEKGLMPAGKSFLDKTQESTYISYWHAPYRVLLEFGAETGLITVVKPSNNSRIVYTKHKDLSLDEIMDELYNWLISKSRTKIIPDNKTSNI